MDGPTIVTALFRIEGATAFPSELTRGPWSPDAQHGGPPSALLTYLVESVTQADWFIARINVELLAPVPLTELTTSTEGEQLSPRVGRVRAELRDGGSLVARATARTLLTSDGMPEPPPAPEAGFSIPGPESERTAPSWAAGDALAFHRDAIRHRWEEGDFLDAGPATCWQNLTVPVVAGSPVTGHQRVMAVADIGSGVSAVFTPESAYGLINSDLDVGFVRAAKGEWVRTDAATRAGQAGTGLCSNTLADEAGVVATATQTLLGRPFRF